MEKQAVACSCRILRGHFLTFVFIINTIEIHGGVIGEGMMWLSLIFIAAECMGGMSKLDQRWWKKRWRKED